jgi:uncharacterized protein
MAAGVTPAAIVSLNIYRQIERRGLMTHVAAQNHFSEVNGIEVILKTVERCNINCSYCYYFRDNHEYRQLPKYIGVDTIKHIANFLVQGTKELGLESIQIDFHGGEPTMQKKEAFDWMCSHFRAQLSPHVALNLAIQTNAMLVDDGWIALFEKHQVHVGVSLDGPKEYHDIARLDYQGKSTYERTMKGLAFLNAAAAQGRIPGVGALCVINPKHDAKQIFNHLVDDLKIAAMDFLLPDYTHDTFDHNTVKQYGDFLCALFDAWSARDFKHVQVRIIGSVLRRLGGDLRSSLYRFSEEKAKALAFTIQSDGKLAPDDVLRTTPLWAKNPQMRVVDTTLYEFLDQAFFQELGRASRTIPDACQSCCWARICGGGGILTHQYSSQNDSVNNPTVYCAGLKDFYSHVSAYLLKNGLSMERLQQALFREEERAHMQATVA